jgi:O-antigen/teichoic acid export membrane protein
MPANKIISSSLILFVDQLLVAATNWFFWIIMSRIATPSEIGQTSSVYSLVLFVSTVAQLGLEYPILKRAHGVDKSKTFVTVLVLEIIINALCIPIILYVNEALYPRSVQTFSLLAIALFFSTSITFISRFYLLGMSNSKGVLATDLLGTVIKFIIGFLLVALGYGAAGLLLSFVLQTIAMNLALGFLIRRNLSVKIGNTEYFREIFKEALFNAPSKLSRSLILSLSVVLLASFGVLDSEIGIFYIALMISIVAGSLAASISYMLIPSSSAMSQDIFSSATRIALSLTAPLVSILIVSPRYLLSLIGSQYTSGDEILIILSIGIIPACIVILSISKLNSLSKFRHIVTIGSLQVVSFMLPFYLLVPYYETMGAAFSILISFAISSAPSIMWLGRSCARSIMGCSLSVTSGVFFGALCNMLIGYEIPSALVSFVATIITLFLLKNLSTLEIKYLVKAAFTTKSK